MTARMTLNDWRKMALGRAPPTFEIGPALRSEMCGVKHVYYRNTLTACCAHEPTDDCHTSADKLVLERFGL